MLLLNRLACHAYLRLGWNLPQIRSPAVFNKAAFSSYVSMLFLHPIFALLTPYTFQMIEVIKCKGIFLSFKEV